MMRLLYSRALQLRVVSQRVRSYAKLPASTTVAKSESGSTATSTPVKLSQHSSINKRSVPSHSPEPRTERTDDAWQQAKSVVKRMEAAGVEPNLSTFVHLLGIACPTAPGDATARRSPARRYSREGLQCGVSLLERMLPRLERRDTISLEEESDGLFFINAMQLAIGAHNMPMAQRVEELYASPKNRVRLTPFLDETEFYSQYLFFCIRSLPSVEKLYQVYARVVPARVMPTRRLTEELLEKFHSTGHYYWPLVRRLIEDNLSCANAWDDRQAGLYRRLLHNTLDSSQLTPGDLELLRNMTDRLLKLSLSFAVMTDTKQPRRQPRSMPLSAALEYVALLFKCGLAGRAWGLLSSLLPGKSEHTGFNFDNNLDRGRDEPQWRRLLLDFFDVAIRTGELMNAITCLNLFKHYFPAEIAAREVPTLVEKIESIMDVAISAEERAGFCDTNRTAN